MSYIYKLHLWIENRTISADNKADEDGDLKAYEFQTIELTDLELDAKSLLEGFTMSRLETLVVLFTGKDPAEMILKIGKDCEHEDDESCDCPPIQIQIPAVLAYHTMTLYREMENLDRRFIHQQLRADQDNQKHIRYRVPNGDLIQGIFDSRSREYREKLEEYQHYLALEKSRILDRWLEQGIALFASLPE